VIIMECLSQRILLQMSSWIFLARPQILYVPHVKFASVSVCARSRLGLRIIGLEVVNVNATKNRFMGKDTVSIFVETMKAIAVTDLRNVTSP